MMRYHLRTFEEQWWHITCRRLKSNEDVSLADVWREMMSYHLPTFEEQWIYITCRRLKNNEDISLADIWRAMKLYHLRTFEEQWSYITCRRLKSNEEISLADVWRAMMRYHLPTFEEQWRDHLRTFEEQWRYITCRHLKSYDEISLADVWRTMKRYHLRIFEEQWSYIPASRRLQSYALDRAATGIGPRRVIVQKSFYHIYGVEYRCQYCLKCAGIKKVVLYYCQTRNFSVIGTWKFKCNLQTSVVSLCSVHNAVRISSRSAEEFVWMCRLGLLRWIIAVGE